VLAATACGASKYTYVKNSRDLTYFKVPSGWHSVDQDKLKNDLISSDPASATAQIEKKSMWSVAFDADGRPAPEHLGMDGGDQPIVLGMVRQLTESERSAVSMDLLRNLFHPVTDTSRQSAAQQGASLQNFELLGDEDLTPGGGIRGIREIYNYAAAPAGTLQTFDLTAYIGDGGKLYVLLIRCSAGCYRQRSGELDTIARSFTVRSHL
jgi:hypothetical protein